MNAAEFGNVAAATVLLNAGANINTARGYVSTWPIAKSLYIPWIYSKLWKYFMLRRS